MKRSALPFVCGRQGRVCSNSTPAAAAASRKFAERRVMLDSAETVAAFARKMSEFLRTSEITETRARYRQELWIADRRDQAAYLP